MNGLLVRDGFTLADRDGPQRVHVLVDALFDRSPLSFLKFLHDSKSMMCYVFSYLLVLAAG